MRVTGGGKKLARGFGGKAEVKVKVKFTLEQATKAQRGE
jgi:ribosomal protein S27E